MCRGRRAPTLRRRPAPAACHHRQSRHGGTGISVEVADVDAVYAEAVGRASRLPTRFATKIGACGVHAWRAQRDHCQRAVSSSTLGARLADNARAMSQENVEVVRRHLQAAAVTGMRLDGLDDQARDRYMEAFHPEVEFREDPMFPEGSVYRGRDALRAYFEGFSSEFDQFWWEAEDVLDAGGEQVLVLIRVRGRGKGSGAEFDGRGGWLFTMEEGLAVRVDAYLDRRIALEAAGLSG